MGNILQYANPIPMSANGTTNKHRRTFRERIACISLVDAEVYFSLFLLFQYKCVKHDQFWRSEGPLRNSENPIRSSWLSL